MNRQHLIDAMLCAVLDYENNVIDPVHRGRYSDLFGYVDVKPYPGGYRVISCSGSYGPAIGQFVAA